MSRKKILVLNGHPSQLSFCQAIADKYLSASRDAGHEVRHFELSKMAFNPSLDNGYDDEQKLEPDLEEFWQALAWCEHFALVHPLWWGGMPAKLKGLFDRTLLPGKAFVPNKKGGLPDKLLAGRSARVIITSDTPKWYFHLGYGAAAYKQADRQILGYCGFKPNKFTMFSPVQTASSSQRQKWLERVEALAKA